MARTWLSIEVQLVAGRGEELWPRPGRVFVARRTFTFRQLAHAINIGFGRWELSHLHRFVLEDGTEILPLEWWDDAPEDAVDDSTRLSILEPGRQFAYEFDLGDGLSPMRDWDQDSWDQLRGAVTRGDGQTVVDLLIRHDPLDAARGAMVPPELAPIPVDLDEVANASRG